MAIDSIVVSGYIPNRRISAGDRVEIRNHTKGVAVVGKVSAVSQSGDGKVTLTAPISLLYDEEDVVFLRRLDENEEFPGHYFAMIDPPANTSFNRQDMRMLAHLISHVARPVIPIEEE